MHKLFIWMSISGLLKSSLMASEMEYREICLGGTATAWASSLQPIRSENFNLQSFIASRSKNVFQNDKDLKSKVDAWNQSLLEAATAKKKKRPKSLKYRIGPLTRLNNTEAVYRGRWSFLEQLRELPRRINALPPYADAKAELKKLAEKMLTNYIGTKPAQYSDGPWLNLKAGYRKRAQRQIDQFADMLKIEKVDTGELRDSFNHYFERMNDYRAKYGKDLFPEDVENAGGFISVGGQLFSNIANLPPHRIKSLDAIALLEPLTDNALDMGLDVSESMAKISKHLDGVKQVPSNAYERAVFDFIDEILDHQPPSTDPFVRDTIKLLHQTQLESIKVQKTQNPKMEDIIRITNQKGGLAVMAAAKILFGQLSPAEAEYFYRLGATFQYADDLVDMASDLKSGSKTIWTMSKQRGQSLGKSFEIYMRAQADLEARTPDLLKNFPNGEAIESFIELGHKTYLLSAMTQSPAAKLLSSRLGNRFPLERENLKKVMVATMRELEMTSPEIKKIVHLIDQEIFNDMYKTFSKKEEGFFRSLFGPKAPDKILGSVKGPPLYWQMIQLMENFKNFHLWIMAKASRKDLYILSQVLFHFYIFATLGKGHAAVIPVAMLYFAGIQNSITPSYLAAGFMILMLAYAQDRIENNGHPNHKLFGP